MMRSTLIGVAMCCVTSATAYANDYIVRVECIGYLDKPATDKRPLEAVLRSIEVIARAESPFHGKMILGDKTLVLRGELKPAKNGRFDVEVDVRYLQSPKTDPTGPVEHARTEVIRVLHALKTSAVLDLDEPVIIGRTKLSTPINGSNEPSIQTRIRHMLVITKYKPPDE